MQQFAGDTCQSLDVGRNRNSLGGRAAIVRFRKIGFMRVVTLLRDRETSHLKRLEFLKQLGSKVSLAKFGSVFFSVLYSMSLECRLRERTNQMSFSA